jgi:hypothetical protein
MHQCWNHIFSIRANQKLMQLLPWQTRQKGMIVQLEICVLGTYDITGHGTAHGAAQLTVWSGTDDQEDPHSDLWYHIWGSYYIHEWYHIWYHIWYHRWYVTSWHDVIVWHHKMMYEWWFVRQTNLPGVGETQWAVTVNIGGVPIGEGNRNCIQVVCGRLCNNI